MLSLRLSSLLLAVIGLAIAPVCPAADAASVLTRYDFAKDSLKQWKLPKKLREISGLAYYDGRLFGHDDQLGIVYQIDTDRARLTKAFAIGRRTTQADFEGIAIVDGTFYLVTSAGRLYVFEEGDNGKRVPHKVHITGLGNRCEIEGLAHDPPGNRLLLVCKEPRIRELEKYVAIFAWSLERQRITEKETLLIKRSNIHKLIPGKQFNPSAIEVDRETGNILLLAARQRAIAELDGNGRVIAAFELPRASLHRQAEGIALTPDNKLIIADEGGTKKARLAIYRPVP